VVLVGGGFIYWLTLVWLICLVVFVLCYGCLALVCVFGLLWDWWFLFWWVVFVFSWVLCVLVFMCFGGGLRFCDGFDTD